RLVSPFPPREGGRGVRSPEPAHWPGSFFTPLWLPAAAPRRMSGPTPTPHGAVPMTTLSRRSFLQASAAAGAALLAPRTVAAADEEFAGFKLGVQSYTFRNFDLEPALKRIQELGL